MPSFHQPDALRHALRLGRAVAHLRPEQILHRARLTAERRARVALRRGWPALVEPPPLAAALPHSPLPAPRARTRAGALRLAGNTIALTQPMDWHPAGLAVNAPLARLELHHLDYLHELDDALARALALDWIAANRPAEPGYWREGWNAYAVSVRTVAWLQDLARRDALREPRVLGSLAAQLRFLERNLERDIGGNHLLRNARALLWAGASFTGADAQRWARTGERLLAEQLERQILPDGMHFELSPAYHAQVLGDLIECHAVAPGARLEAAIGAMRFALAQLIHPDGGVSLLNDGGLSMARDPAALGLPAPQPRFVLRSAGLYGLRAPGWLLVLDAGRLGPPELPAHAHADALAFELSAGGRRIVVDAGVYEYAAGAARAWARSTSAHNTVTVADADQGELFASFRAGRLPAVTVEQADVSGVALDVAARHDGFTRLAGKPVHRRRVRATAGGAVRVQDEVLGGQGQAVVARLLLHPDVEVSQTAERRAELRAGEVALALEASVPIAARDSWWSPDLGERRPARQLELAYGAAPAAGWHELTPILPRRP